MVGYIDSTFTLKRNGADIILNLKNEVPEFNLEITGKT
jgi:hypothetical protein